MNYYDNMETIEINTESANLTEEQFFQLCIQNKEINFERDKNKNIIIMSPTGFFSSRNETRILSQLEHWNAKSKSGYVTGPSGGYILPNGAMRAPDAAWIIKERMDKLSLREKERFPHLCPDFIAEVRSKTDSLKLLKEKMNEWIDSGCRLAWLIDFENKTTHIYKPGRDITLKSFNDTLNGEEVLPGFELKLTELK